MDQDILPYIETLFARSKLAGRSLPEFGIDKDVILDWISGHVSTITQKYSVNYQDDLLSLNNIIFSALKAAGVIAETKDKFAPSFYKFNGNQFKLWRSNYLENSPSHHKALSYGGDFFTKVFENFLEEHPDFLNQDANKKAESSLNVPASDRIVRLDDNDPSTKSLREDAERFVDELKSANDFGDLTEDEVTIAIHQSEQLADLLEQPVVRNSDVKRHSVDLLRWIGEQAGGAIIGAGAIALLTAIAAFFGFVL